MGLRKEFIKLLSEKIVDELIEQNMIDLPDELNLEEQLFHLMEGEINLEDRVNDEVRGILNQYTDQMRQTGASYQEMFKLVKSKIVKERKLVL